MIAIDRRAAIGGGALALAGCTATPPVRSASAGPRVPCPPPVRVAADRVIRTVAGLRPYRPSGFRVAAEALGPKRLVHNYGHGGGGITLSWGSSRLAVDLALQGQTGGVAVIGAGVMGLTTARLVQEAGYPVTIYTDRLPPETTSNIAGGQWYPSSVVNRVGADPAFDGQLRAAALYSYRRYQLLVGDDYGVRWMTNYVAAGSDWRPDAMDRLLEGMLPESRLLAPGEHGFPFPHVHQYGGMIVEPARFLRAVERDVRIAGGRIEIRRMEGLADLAVLPEPTIINCTGLGAATLVSDAELTPVRGQLAVLLPQAEVDYALFAPGLRYMFSRPDGIVLGGTWERGVGDPMPQPERIARIVAGHRELFSQWRCG
nr:FAD-dependent oxidoreductase [Sphingomonas jejuensis]